MTPIRLRDFIYLDAARVERLLSQVEGGVTDDEALTDREKIDRKRGAGVRTPALTADIGKVTESETSVSRTVRQTADSACSRLIDLLEKDQSLQFLEAFDLKIWDQLKRGEALEIEADLEVPTLLTLTSLGESIGALGELMESFGGSVDADALRAIKGLTALGGMMKTFPVIAAAHGSPEYKFICSLIPEAFRIDRAQVGGEARVFGTLERQLRPGESWSVLDVMGFAGLPRAMRRDMQTDLARSGELGDLVIEPPAAILNPIAIYR